MHKRELLYNKTKNLTVVLFRFVSLMLGLLLAALLRSYGRMCLLCLCVRPIVFVPEEVAQHPKVQKYRASTLHVSSRSAPENQFLPPGRSHTCSHGSKGLLSHVICPGRQASNEVG